MFRLTFLLPLIFLGSNCQQSENFFPDALCITHVNTIDAVHGLQENQTVIIKDHRILKAEPSADLPLSADNQIIDAKGKYLIPGLWDAHVHFAYIEELAPSMPGLFLAYGVTSVRDTGGKLDFVKKYKDNALADPANAPRIMVAGPLLDGMPNVYDGSDASRPPLSLGAASVEEAVALVDRFVSQGVDFIKAYEMLTPEQFEAVAKRTKSAGLKLTGHVPLSMDVITASNAGLNSMEHMRNLELSCAGNADRLLEQRRALLRIGAKDPGGVLRSRIHSAQRSAAVDHQDEKRTKAVLDVLAKNQTWQIPTLTIMTAMSHRPYLRPEWQASFTYVPDTIRQRWMESIATIAETEVSEDQQKYQVWASTMLKKINEAGIGIMAGTDCPIAFLTPGLSLHEELALMVKFGLSPMDALKAATLRPAEYFGLDQELGLIIPGMRADLVLLEANPLEDITNTQKIKAVIKEGKLHSRSDLDKILKTLETDF